MGKTRIITAAIVAALLAIGAYGVPDSEEVSKSAPERVEIAVGDVLSGGDLHIITHPGRYGLGPELPGSRYAVAKGRLIRVDADSNKVLSILRVQEGILD